MSTLLEIKSSMVSSISESVSPKPNIKLVLVRTFGLILLDSAKTARVCSYPALISLTGWVSRLTVSTF